MRIGRAKAVRGRRYCGRKQWKEAVEEEEVGEGSVGSGEVEENQKGAMRPALTIPNLDFPEGCFGARIGHEDLAIEGEDNGVLCEVDHAAHDITRLPGAPKWFTAQVPALAL